MRYARALRIGVVATLLAWSSTALATEPTFRFDDQEAKEIRAALDVFEQQNPGIHVKLEQTNWGDAISQPRMSRRPALRRRDLQRLLDR